jgi:hypothetical protein
MRCGRQAANWLVTAPCEGVQGPGRLLVYCDRCRSERRDSLWVAIPIDVVTGDADRVLSLLYEQQLTETEPDTAAEVLEQPGMWVDHAKRVMARRSPT